MMILRLAALSALISMSWTILALAQTPATAPNAAPGQVRMQIPLGGQPAAARPAANNGSGAVAPGANGAGSAGNLPKGASQFPFQTGQGVPAAPVSQIFSSDAGMESLLTEEMIRGLRDPFSPPASLTKRDVPKSELETIQLKDLHLNGIITGPKKVRAMLTGNNKTFFVAVGDKVGVRQGRIASIQPDLIKVVEYEVDDRGRRVPEVFEVRMTGEIVSLSKKDEE